MVFLDLDEAFKLGGVCVFFHQIVKSPLFIKFFVTLKERTKVEISPNHLTVSQKPKKREDLDEDRMAQIELLKNMKVFLTD